MRHNAPMKPTLLFGFVARCGLFDLLKVGVSLAVLHQLLVKCEYPPAGRLIHDQPAAVGRGGSDQPVGRQVALEADDEAISLTAPTKRAAKHTP